MSWPTVPLPSFSSLSEEVKGLYRPIEDLYRILRGQIVIAGLTEEDSFPNCNTAIVDTVQVPDISVRMDNPLGREPIGVLNIWGPAMVKGVFSVHNDVNVTADSTTATLTAGTFDTDIAGGYFTAQTSMVKILTRDSGSQITLDAPWPGTTDTNIDGSTMREWEPDKVYLRFTGPGGATGEPISYRLFFF